MFKSNSFIVLLFFVVQTGFCQDGLNQVIIANSGEFGNPNERSTLAYFNPVAMDYELIDTLPSNAIQHIIIDDDFVYVAAQNYILKYDLDSYELMGMVPFPGLSTHQLAIYNDKLLATNFYGQTEDNLYIFDKHTLSVVDTVEEIVHPGGTMVVYGEELYVSQNEKGDTDGCPPFGCFNDTMGYLSIVDLNTNQWQEDIPLDNNGNECGRIVRNGSSIIALNDNPNTVTAFLPLTDESVTEEVNANISTSRYRTESEVIGGSVVSLFDNGVGILSKDIMSVEAIIDTPVTAFAYDLINDRYYLMATDFFSYNIGYAFDFSGQHLYDFPVGINPEAIAMHYNRQPIGNDFSAESEDTIIIDVNSIASDPDGDNIVASRIENAPLNGILTILEDGSIRYVSLSLGSADAFRVEVCDEKLNPLCSFINVTILPISGLESSQFDNVSIYPNPVRETLTIHNPVANATYELINSLGATLKVFNQSSFKLSELAGGMYYLRMQKDGDQKVFPILKQ